MKTKRFTEVALLDVCTSDYFSGYPFPVLQVAMYADNISCRAMARSIKEEINFSWDCLVGDNDRQYTEEEIKLFERYANKLGRTKGKFFTKDLGIDWSKDCEDDEPVYVFFGLCKPVHSYGLTFLNA